MSIFSIVLIGILLVVIVKQQMLLTNLQHLDKPDAKIRLLAKLQGVMVSSELVKELQQDASDNDEFELADKYKKYLERLGKEEIKLLKELNAEKVTNNGSSKTTKQT